MKYLVVLMVLFLSFTLSAKEGMLDDKGKIKIITINPNKPDRKAQQKVHKRKKGYNRDVEAPIYLVKLYCGARRISSMGTELYIGDERIRNYAGFKKGIAFKVFDKDRLLEFAGKQIVWKEAQGGIILSDNLTFPSMVEIQKFNKKKHQKSNWKNWDKALKDD
jgi:hypothetical protein